MDPNGAIEIVYPNNNNNNKKGIKIKRGGRRRRREGRRGGGEFLNLIFFLFSFFSDLLKLDRRFSSELKAKLIYATRATHGH